jgi:DNA-binding transcriptional LysR family regulator
MIPTETELTHFLEVYRTKHFTRASIKLGIAQPSLTQSILKLEEKTGVQLFYRTKQGCIPTPSADTLYDKATSLQELWKSVSGGISEKKDALSGTFRLGCHQSVGAYTLPRFFKALAKGAPAIEIKLYHDWSRKITEKIVGYELDLGFVVNPAKHRDLVLIKLGTDRVAFWRAKGLTPGKLIFTDADSSQIKNMLGKKFAARFSDYRLVESSSLELVRTLTLNGAGIGVLPERVAKAESNALEMVDATLPTLQDDIYLVYRADTLKSAAGRALIEAAKHSIERHVKLS